MLEAFRQMGRFTGELRYYDFIRRNLEYYVKEDGSIRTYRREDYNLDMIAGGARSSSSWRRRRRRNTVWLPICSAGS